MQKHSRARTHARVNTQHTVCVAVSFQCLIFQSKCFDVNEASVLVFSDWMFKEGCKTHEAQADSNDIEPNDVKNKNQNERGVSTNLLTMVADLEEFYREADSVHQKTAEFQNGEAWVCPHESTRWKDHERSNAAAWWHE